jgi:hypothetical protein
MQENKHYIKLPYIGKISCITKIRLLSIAKKYCKDIHVTLVFTPLKIGSYFSPKDRVPQHLRSHVIYEFICLGCNAKYIGLTTRHLETRVREHLSDDRGVTAIAQHLRQSEKCKKLCTPTCFKVIDYSPTTAKLKIKEALHIVAEKPELNAQVRHENLLLFT